MKTLLNVGISALLAIWAVLLILGALQRRAGITSVISRPGGDQWPGLERAQLLKLAGFALMVGTQLVPGARYWALSLLLLLVAGCLLVAAMAQVVVISRRRR